MTEKSIKILYISDSFLNNSGCAVIARNTYEIFKKKGFDVELFTSKNYCHINNYKYEKYFPEIYNTTLKYLKNIHKYYYNYESANKLEMYLNDFMPDIVHIHNLRSSSITYSILNVLKKYNIPTVMTLHDVSLICPMMTLTKGNGQFCEKFLCKGMNKIHCLTNKCAPNGFEQAIRRSLFSFISDSFGNIRYIQKFITPSLALNKLIIQADIGIKKNQIQTINNFLSEEELQTLPNFDRGKYFLFIGRLSQEKGVHFLLQAMKYLPKEIELHIVGKGVEEENLKSYARENNLDNVKFLGFKNREEIKEEYQNCIATILPCNWFENFPTTNMESFINGKPVIASNIGGIPEQVEHNKTGLLFEPTNVEELKQCILKYWNNNNLVIEHGKNAYVKAKEIYSIDRYFKELNSIYQEVIR